jgi:TPR repeat protein
MLRNSAALLLLALVAACRPPADEARQQAGHWPEPQRAEFLDGYRQGSAMVDTALRAGRAPWLLRAGSGSEASAGPLPPGMVQTEAPPRPEQDPATGWPIHYLPMASPFAHGQLAGFDQALLRQRPELARRGLLRPGPTPVLPGQWLRWPVKGSELTLEAGPLAIRVQWQPGLLAWTSTEQGFPPLRRWRPAPAWLRPRYLALQPGTLWLETPDQGALALDLETGAIAAILPAPAHPAGDGRSGLEADLEQERARMALPEQVAHLAGLRRRAAAGDAAAMFELSKALVPDDGDPDGMAAKVLWLLESARRGHVPAMMEMASLYFAGRGLTQDLPEARSWSEKAARSGDPTAQLAFRTMFPQP